MKKISLSIILCISLIVLMDSTFSFAIEFSSSTTDVNYSRDDAIKYAKDYCGTGTTEYNPAYRRWNGDSESENPGEGEVDCANFVSQALIDGGMNFNDAKGTENIGQGEKEGTRGFASVANLKEALLKRYCFEKITDPTKVQKGDLLFMKPGYGSLLLALRWEWGFPE